MLMQQQLVGMDQVALAMQTESVVQNLRELGLKLKQLVEQYRV